MAMNQGLLEQTHNYFQKWFPLPEASGSIPHATLLTADVITAFRHGPDCLRLQNSLRGMFEIMVEFWGFRIQDIDDDEDGTVQASSSSVYDDRNLTRRSTYQVDIGRRDQDFGPDLEFETITTICA